VTRYEPEVVRQDWNEATDREWAEALAGIPLFARLGKRRLRDLARQGEFLEFAPGDFVVGTGDRADSLYVILSGEATARGKLAARTMRIGDFFGEMALLGADCRTATVVAISELHVLRLSRRTFAELIERDAGVAHTILTELGQRVRRLEGRAATA
jgi:CRP-like cAMP-binding protein